MQSSRFRWKTANPLDMDRDRETAADTNTEIRSLLKYNYHWKETAPGAHDMHTQTLKRWSSGQLKRILKATTLVIITKVW